MVPLIQGLKNKKVDNNCKVEEFLGKLDFSRFSK